MLNASPAPPTAADSCSKPTQASMEQKTIFYQELCEQAAVLMEGHRHWVTNLANISALIYHNLNEFHQRAQSGIRVNWCGFYLNADLIQDQSQPPEGLRLGPFQGRVACTFIPQGKGVCGAAAMNKKALLVEDVHAFPGHIACDVKSLSEIVVPLLHNGSILGVLDIDSEQLAGFDLEDQRGLEMVVRILVRACDWT